MLESHIKVLGAANEKLEGKVKALEKADETLRVNVMEIKDAMEKRLRALEENVTSSRVPADDIENGTLKSFSHSHFY